MTKTPLLLLVALSVGMAQTTILVPSTYGTVVQVLSGAGTSPTVLTTTPNTFSAGAVVEVTMIAEYTGTNNQLSGLNSPTGTARKICAAGLTSSTVELCDVSTGNPVNTSNAVLPYSGFIRLATTLSVPTGPHILMDGTCGKVTTAIAATIVNGCLTSITVSSGTATIHYPNPHQYGSTGATLQVQVRNAASSDLNGIKTVTVTGANTVTYSTTAGNTTDTSPYLSVSERALDGINYAWERTKSYATNYSSRINYVAPGGESNSAAIFANCAAAARWWIIDPSQTTLLSWAMTYCISQPEDFAPGSGYCYEGTNYGCQDGSYNRINAMGINNFFQNAMSVFEDLCVQGGQCSSGQKTSWIDYWNPDRDDSTGCTSHRMGSTAAGTITVGAQVGNSITITAGSGASFSGYAVGDWIMTWNSSYGGYDYARILSNGGSTLTVTWPLPSGSGISYWYVPQHAAGDCGPRWFTSHFLSHPGTRESRLYQTPLVTGEQCATSSQNYYPCLGDWMIYRGNNQAATEDMAVLSIAEAFAAFDSRAAALLQRQVAWLWDYELPEQVGSWGPLSKSGPTYKTNRTDWMVQYLARSLVLLGLPSIWSSPGTAIGVRNKMLDLIYSKFPESTPSDVWTIPCCDSYAGDWGQGFSYGVNDLTAAALWNAAPSSAEGTYFRYWLENIASGTWASTTTQAPFDATITLALWDPNGPSGVNYTSLPTQVELEDTDSAELSAFGMAWTGQIRGEIISRSGWTGPATLVPINGYGQGSDNTPNPNGSQEDHSISAPAGLHIWKQTAATGTTGCLIGENGSNCNSGGSTMGDWTISSSLNLGTWNSNHPVGAGPFLNTFDIISMVNWSGANKYGDPTSAHMCVGLNATSYFIGVSKGVRQVCHSHPTGGSEYVATYDYATSSGQTMASNWIYPQGGSVYSSGSTSVSGSAVTSTTAEGWRVLSAFLSPAGSNSMAVINAGLATNSASGTTAYRVYTCASADGSTCNSSATGYEALAVHDVTSSSDSALTASLLAPDSNWAGILAKGSTSAAVFLWARNGTLRSTVTSFTPSFSGTAQWNIVGLSAGTYTVTVGGTQVSGSPFTVAAADTSISFPATAGAFVLYSGGSSGGSSSSATGMSGNVMVKGNAGVH